MRQTFAPLDENENFWEIPRKTLKISEENPIEKLNFYFIFILEHLLLKREPSEITPFFYNNLFGLGAISPFPLATPF